MNMKDSGETMTKLLLIGGAFALLVTSCCCHNHHGVVYEEEECPVVYDHVEYARPEEVHENVYYEHNHYDHPGHRR